ncbi:MAG: response regulator [Acidobacteria bacterium 13_1_40CM_2_68_5]|nr:MAG: response regulator [Acidobacteria bacterium 13_1_40CM_2_68_5]OLE66905.1 MAG: response regulator [Acidobacteria bacterium 13_1_20CM_2_68_7]
MKILIAEDDAVSRRVLEATLVKWGFEVTTTTNGTEAWEVLVAEGAPKLAILDWMMPEIDGLEICRRVRQRPDAGPLHVILLTARGRKEDVIAGLQAGADDYVTKPFDHEELRARVQVGVRLIELQSMLADRVVELEEAIARVRQLRGLLPICSYCKKVRDDKNYWQQVEQYVSTHAEVKFSHGICPDCYREVVEPQLDAAQRASGAEPDPRKKPG